jgi:PAS domain S-box-containing protein
MNLDGNFTYISPSVYQLRGYTAEEVMKQSMLEVLTPESARLVIEDMQRSLNTGIISSNYYELEQPCKDGSTVWTEVTFTILRDTRGNPSSVLGVSRDINERKKTERDLKESEEKFRKAFETSPDACYIGTLEDGFIIDVNDAFSHTWGYSKEECLGKTSLQLGLYAKGPPDRQRMLSELRSKGHFSNLEFDGIRKNGQVFPILFSGTILELGGKKLIYGILRDITEPKKAEDAIVQEYNKFKSVTEAIGAGLAIINKDYHVLWANDFIKQYKGDVIGKLCYATLNSLDSPCLDCGVAKIFAGKTTFDSHEYCSTSVDGKPYWVEIVATPITDGHGNITSAVEIAIDITERKKAEDQRKVLERKVRNYSEHLKCMVDLRTAQLKDANERLVKSERFSAIGELAGMIGHDLRNPLAGIKNATYYLKKKGTTISEAQTQEMIEIIDKSIDHSDKIINDLLDYSREMHLELTKYSAYALVAETLEMIKVPDRIKIVNSVQQDNWIWVNEDKMRRVFINLVKNAIDAMPEKGTLEIYSCPRNDWVEIVFADSGVGIPEEIMQKLFTPLFTTKAQGMGFGLAICKRIIEAHGGTIKVKSKVNKGTTFIIRLPPKS